MFVVIEGTDASGKNTQARRLEAEADYERLSFPRYDSLMGAAILRHLKKSIAVMERHIVDSSDMNIDGDERMVLAKEDPLIFQAMMLADKLAVIPHIDALVRSGRNIVCDRWWQSGFAYGKADGVDEGWLLSTSKGLHAADVNIFLDVRPEVTFKRRPEARDRYEKDRTLQETVRRNYLQLWDGMAREEGPASWVVIDGEKIEDEVAASVRIAVERRRDMFRGGLR